MLIDRLKTGHVRLAYEAPRAATLATSAWLSARGLIAPPRWTVSIALDARPQPASHEFDAAHDTRFHISLNREEWGFFFCHAGKASWIRVTDVAGVFERDEYALVADVPPLRDLGSLVQKLEERHTIRFHRQHASIRTNIPAADSTIRIWVAASI
jgi:hypothetical protein